MVLQMGDYTHMRADYKLKDPYGYINKEYHKYHKYQKDAFEKLIKDKILRSGGSE